MTFVSSIDGNLLKEMLLSGVFLLEKNKEAIDALNVFPVPDGDTGTNMSMTMISATKELSHIDSSSAAQVAEAIARGALKGARGNSGVILSQLYRGFAKGIEGHDHVDTTTFAKALRMGSEAAYKAVMKPKEGTILTVAREIAEKAVEYAQNGGDLYGLLENILVWGEDVLKRTTDMLPVLKQAGVVDAGGKGLLILYIGYKMAIDGEAIEDIDSILNLQASIASFDLEQQDDSIEFAYCTEFLIQQIKQGITEAHIDRLRERLSRIGDCVLVVGDTSLLKVHVHSNDPGKALQYSLMLGTLSSIKIDNMREQHRHLFVEEQALEHSLVINQAFGIVSICAGDGLAMVMKDLGASQIVSGGQTMNPSTEDIVEAARRTHAKDVYILPNNPNIILAAQQAVELVTEQTLHLVPTRTVPQGVAALVAFMPDRKPEDNIQIMKDAASAVRTGSVTYAVRDSKLNGKKIRKGDIMGLNDKTLDTVGSDIEKVSVELIGHMLVDAADLLTVFYGADISKEQADSLAKTLSAKHADIDIEVVSGGQPLYYYLISVE